MDVALKACRVLCVEQAQRLQSNVPQQRSRNAAGAPRRSESHMSFSALVMQRRALEHKRASVLITGPRPVLCLEWLSLGLTDPSGLPERSEDLGYSQKPPVS